MKKLLYLLILSISMVFYSCDDNFDPFSAFEKEYVLNCILSADSTTQYATITTTYPSTSSIEDPAIQGAEITVTTRTGHYIFRDTSSNRIDSTRYKTPFRYYVANFKPTRNDSVSITAKLTDGTALSSKNKIPNLTSIEFDPKGGIFERNSALNIKFTNSDKDVYFLPKIFIHYKKAATGDVDYKFEVPSSVKNINGSNTVLYPSISKTTAVSYDKGVFDWAFENLAPGAERENITISKTELSIIVTDPSLSNYIASTNGFLDNLSIRLDEPNYTNIVGGLGVFGSFIVSQYRVGVGTDYISTFGYKF